MSIIGLVSPARFLSGGLAENSIQKLLLQLAHNAGSMGFKRHDVFEGLQHVFPANSTRDEKL